MPRGLRTAVVSLIALAGVLACTSVAVAAPAAAEDEPDGTVLASRPLPRERWIPDVTGDAFALTYVSRDARGRRAPVTGQVFVPKGEAPPGGWKVISWAHGTSGLPDACAPSVKGPSEPDRDLPYLARWMREGYAVVASDYVGLGGPGLPAYLNGPSEAHNVVDMVRAARSFAAAHLPAAQQLSRRWVAIGQSQGGGAAIYTARYATGIGGADLDYRGAVGTGVPAYVEKVLSLLGPAAPPVPDPGGHIAAYLVAALASIDDVHPELGLSAALTPYGRARFDIVRTRCVGEAAQAMKGTVLGLMFTRPVAGLPNWGPTVEDYMKMPESGFDRPFFMGHGLLDTDVPYAGTAPYVAALTLHHEPLTFRTYPADHSGALVRSQQDAIPFVARLFAAG